MTQRFTLSHMEEPSEPPSLRMYVHMWPVP